MKKVLVSGAVAALLAGCSNIGHINGVPVGPNAHVSSQGTPTYCQANPAICIIGGVVAAGVVGFVISEANDGSSAPAPTTTERRRPTKQPMVDN